MDQYLSFHHIGIACSDIEKTKAHYIAMGYTASSIVDDPIQHVRVAFLEKPGEPRLELLESLDDQSPIKRTLESVGVAPYHMCYSVPDIKVAIKSLRKRRFLLVSGPVPACALDGRQVAFLFHKDIGLTELVEMPS